MKTAYFKPFSKKNIQNPMSILDKIKTMKKAGPLFLDLHLIKPSQCSSIGVVYSVETVLDATTSDFILDDGTTSYRKYAFMAVCPYIGVEYALTRKVHIVLRADCLLDVTSRQPDFPLGPRIYFGFMFWR